MGKHFVPPTALTPADRLREALDRGERQVNNMRGAGPRAVDTLYVFDQLAEGLAALDGAGADVRSERARFETLQRLLRRRKNRFLSEVGAALQVERASTQPDKSRWWWFLDKEAARQRKARLRRTLTWGLAAVLLLVVAGLAYNRFLAPPPEIREAFQRTARAESLVEEGDLQGALSEFASAAALNPEDPTPWLWQGAILVELGAQDDAQAAFEKAQSLYGSEADLLLDRAMIHLQLGNLTAADVTVAKAIALTPQEGRGYYVRAAVLAQQGDYDASIDDLEHAAELASAAGDTQLEAAARAQRAMVIQLRVYGQPTLSP